MSQHHTCWHEQHRTQCSIHYTAVLWCTTSEDFTRHECLFNILSESLLYEFLNLSTGGQGPSFYQTSASAQPQQFTKKWGIKHRKINQVRQMACFFKIQKDDWLWHNHKKMPVADGLSPSPKNTCMQITTLLFYFSWIFFFLRTNFIMGITALYRLPGCDKLHPMHNGWQLWITNIPPSSSQVEEKYTWAQNQYSKWQKH